MLVNRASTPSKWLTICIDVIRQVPTRQESSDGFTDGDTTTDGSPRWLNFSPVEACRRYTKDYLRDQQVAGDAVEMPEAVVVRQRSGRVPPDEVQQAGQQPTDVPACGVDAFPPEGADQRRELLPGRSRYRRRIIS